MVPSLMLTVQQFHWLQHKTRAGVRGSSHVLCCSPWPSHRSPSSLPLLLPYCKRDKEAQTEYKREKMRGRDIEWCVCEKEREREKERFHVLNTTSITNTENNFPVSSRIGLAISLTRDHARGTQTLWPKLLKVRLMTS